MKLISLSTLGILLAFQAQAADLTPNSMEALADPVVTMLKPTLADSEFRFNLSFTEANRNVIDPASENTVPNKVIQRHLSLAIGLPLQTEIGFSLTDTQSSIPVEDAEIFGSIDHASKPLGAAIWARWTMLNSQFISAAATLQYAPGLSTAASFNQASQDRSSVALDLGLRPNPWVRTAVYASYSRRENETYRESLLNNEQQLGLRLALGSEQFGIFGDTLNRQLQISARDGSKNRELQARRYTSGLYLTYAGISLSVFALVPDSHRYPGIPERGLGASLSMSFGASKTSSTVETFELSKNLNPDGEAPKQTTVMQEPLPKILESEDPDEFQLLDRRNQQDLTSATTETPAEKAEREMRLQLEAEKSLEVQEKNTSDIQGKQDARSLKQNLIDDDHRAVEYRHEIDQEINRNGLPDQEDLNWNGLQH